MNTWLRALSALIVFVLIGESPVSAAVPRTMNVQGQLTDDSGNAVPAGFKVFIFKIFDAETGGNQVWPAGPGESQPVLTDANGLWTAHVGALIPLSDTVFQDTSRWLEVTVNDGVNPMETLSRLRLDTGPYAFRAEASRTAGYAEVAEQALRSRDVYHQIMDINPSSTTQVHFITRSNTLNVSLYVYGSVFQGTVAAHTHEGGNSHTHIISGAVGSASGSHAHPFSGTTGNADATHSHSGSTSFVDLSHSHGLSISDHNLSHNHGGASGANQHRHDFWSDGLAGTGNYLVHGGEPDRLSSSDTPDRLNLGSVGMGQSSHSHSILSDLGAVGHSGSIGSFGGNHSHSFTTGSTAATHAHGFSGTTGADNITHSHTFSATASAFGDGLSIEGLSPSVLPSNVSIYLDGVPVGGPFNGAFSTGELNLSAFVSGPGEHIVEIREEGGSGGRISYNLFVE